ncbi:MAG TPA: xanthine dehydrogenase family protein molybdopterin-binding subunit [Alphaproteobacteria bacterium]|nr:xanthine dehydrogenase family protein molybdopterin-binding subunit [Alphaproteobacteria bacterium]
MTATTAKGIGAALPRKEDDRFLRGHGEYVGDVQLDGMLEVAFVRSPVAHGRLRAVTKPAGAEDRVFTAADLSSVRPIRAVSGLPGFKASEQPVLASGKVRHVGELVAACVAPTRAEAEDLASQVTVEIQELPAVVDMVRGREVDAPRLHEQWGDNVFLETFVDGDIAQIAKQAPIKVTRHLRTSRQCMSPIEGRGVVARWDRRLDQLVIISAAQMPHITRSGLAECLGIDHGQVRVIAPDVGGGFGYKGILLPEEVCLGWLAMKLGRPVAWLEDRREQLTANANCREHDYEITAYADRDGRLLAIDCEATVDAGAYSSYPFSACLEAAQVASILPGPYKFDAYRCRTWSVATNKPPILPYRGVARTGVCFAMELMVDAVARAAGREPWEVRLLNLPTAAMMPFDNITKKHFDSGDYPECLRRAAAAVDVPDVRARQARGEPDGRRVGVGFAVFCEQAAHGTSVYYGWGIPMVPGMEQCQARLTPDGVLELRIGAHSHGQGLETTMAQVAHSVLGIAPENVRLIHGDTALSPYSTGTWGSRCAVMSGGAVAAACKEMAARVIKIGAHLLQADPATIELRGGEVRGARGSISLREIAYTWYRAPQNLPADVDPGGLELTAGYKPKRDTGTFSYAAHAAVVAVDPETGAVDILKYVIVEDGGVLLNPMIVDGQVLGGTAQGIGTALYEEMPYSAAGQPLASTLADYLLPASAEMPHVAIEHMETPSPYSEFGQKGIGEGGAIGPPAAIANAINDALRDLGVEVAEVPVTPARLHAAISAALRKRSAA